MIFHVFHRTVEEIDWSKKKAYNVTQNFEEKNKTSIKTVDQNELVSEIQ